MATLYLGLVRLLSEFGLGASVVIGITQRNVHHTPISKPLPCSVVFRDDIIPGIRREGRRITLYASEKDTALQASKKWNVDKPRAGQGGRESIVVVDGVETVDVSRVSEGHSYIGTSGFVLGALRKVFAGVPRPIADRSKPEAPLWEEEVTNAKGQPYWLMQTKGSGD